jgi:hypothetical protein
MIRKSGNRFSEKIMLNQNAGATIDSIQEDFALGGRMAAHNADASAPWLSHNQRSPAFDVGPALQHEAVVGPYRGIGL